jgi:hypothetical protein
MLPSDDKLESQQRQCNMSSSQANLQTVLSTYLDNARTDHRMQYLIPIPSSFTWIIVPHEASLMTNLTLNQFDRLTLVTMTASMAHLEKQQQ